MSDDVEMTVGELIERLSAFPRHLPVRLSYDSGCGCGSPDLVQEMLVTSRDPERCVVISWEDGVALDWKRL